MANTPPNCKEKKIAYCILCSHVTFAHDMRVNHLVSGNINPHQPRPLDGTMEAVPLIMNKEKSSFNGLKLSLQMSTQEWPQIPFFWLGRKEKILKLEATTT